MISSVGLISTWNQNSDKFKRNYNQHHFLRLVIHILLQCNFIFIYLLKMLMHTCYNYLFNRILLTDHVLLNDIICQTHEAVLFLSPSFLLLLLCKKIAVPFQIIKVDQTEQYKFPSSSFISSLISLKFGDYQLFFNRLFTHLFFTFLNAKTRVDQILK